MKALASKFSFYVGFLVGGITLYVFLRQVWFERSFSPHLSSGSGLDVSALGQHELEEDGKNWKKERSALFNLNHPHHKGTDYDIYICVCICMYMCMCIYDGS